MGSWDGDDTAGCCLLLFDGIEKMQLWHDALLPFAVMVVMGKSGTGHTYAGCSFGTLQQGT